MENRAYKISGSRQQDYEYPLRIADLPPWPDDPPAPTVCPGCWRDVPTPHDVDGVRLCDQEAAEIARLRQHGDGNENAKLALRFLQRYRDQSERVGIVWQCRAS
jgi:hypothetical protein